MKKYLLLFSFAMIALTSCEHESDTIKPEAKMQKLENSETPHIKFSDNFGEYIYDASPLENGNYSALNGYIRVDGETYNSKIDLPSNYLNNICYAESEDNSFVITGVYGGDSRAIANIKERSRNSIELQIESENGVDVFTINNGIMPDLLMNLSGSGCGQDGIYRPIWVPVAVAAVIGVATTLACGHWNDNAESNCINAAAQGCPDGIDSFDFRGGTCGGGDCIFTCK